MSLGSPLPFLGPTLPFLRSFALPSLYESRSDSALLRVHPAFLRVVRPVSSLWILGCDSVFLGPTLPFLGPFALPSLCLSVFLLFPYLSRSLSLSLSLSLFLSCLSLPHLFNLSIYLSISLSLSLSLYICVLIYLFVYS